MLTLYGHGLIFPHCAAAWTKSWFCLENIKTCKPGLALAGLKEWFFYSRYVIANQCWSVFKLTVRANLCHKFELFLSQRPIIRKPLFVVLQPLVTAAESQSIQPFLCTCHRGLCSALRRAVSEWAGFYVPSNFYPLNIRRISCGD